MIYVYSDLIMVFVGGRRHWCLHLWFYFHFNEN